MSPRPFTASLVLLVLAGSSLPARASDTATDWSSETLLRAFFPASERVTYVRVQSTYAADELKVLLGTVPAKPSYVIFVARTGQKIDGYAFIDDEQGEHLPITFGVKVSPDGAVERMEVMAYREAYGGEVREKRFRDQFVGKQAGDPVRAGDDVVAISGATISSKAMATGIRRALALISVVKKHALDVAQAARPPLEASGAR